MPVSEALGNHRSRLRAIAQQQRLRCAFQFGMIEARKAPWHAQKLTGAVTLQLEFLTRFGSGQSRREAVTRRLENTNGEIEIGRFTVGAQ